MAGLDIGRGNLLSIGDGTSNYSPQLNSSRRSFPAPFHASPALIAISASASYELAVLGGPYRRAGVAAEDEDNEVGNAFKFSDDDDEEKARGKRYTPKSPRRKYSKTDFQPPAGDYSRPITASQIQLAPFLVYPTEQAEEKKPLNVRRMKFTHSLNLNAVPDWAEHYVNYSQLKKIIYQIERVSRHRETSTDQALEGEFK